MQTYLSTKCTSGAATNILASPRPTSSSMTGYPKVMPRICGIVARKPKLTPELATRMLFGPGVKLIEARNGTLGSINAVGKACITPTPGQQLPHGAGPYQRKRRSPRGLRHSCSSTITYGLKVVRLATASERPSVGPGRARGDEPARIPQGHPGQYEVLISDAPRHQPARPETRPNQRLYVPLGSPPSVAVGSSSARAAHRSRAPKLIA